MNDNIDLTQFDEDFAEADVQDQKYVPVPDDKYQVVVDNVELTRARTSGNPMLKWTLKILGPKYAGRLIWRNSVISTQSNLRWLKTDLHLCGLEIDKLSDLPARLAELRGVKLEINKKSQGENTNVYFNRRIVTDGGGQEAQPIEEALTPF